MPEPGAVIHLLIVRYVKPPEEVAPHVAGHVAYLDRWHREGAFLVSGESVPSDLGGAIVAVGGRPAVEAIAAEDPFVRAGVARYEIITIEPGRVHPQLEALLPSAPPEDTGWDEEAFKELRSWTVDLGPLLAGRPLRPVLQHAGAALLKGLRAGRDDLAALARRCSAELEDRDWPGDDVLALELRQALGEEIQPPEGRSVLPWPLKAVSVDLEELAGALDGNPADGPAALDLSTGDVWLPAVLEEFEPPELDEESDAYDPERFLHIEPESHDAFRDMNDFALTVPDERLRDRLLDALEGGRGAFRRFRDALSDTEDTSQTRWQIFRTERATARARDWLAAEGYTPA
jgi:uncharacterized protein YciI